MAETWNSSSPREGQNFSQIDTNGIGFPVTNMWYFGGNVRKLRSIFLYRSDSKSSNIFRGSLPKIPKRGQLLGGINAKEPPAIDWAGKHFRSRLCKHRKYTTGIAMNIDQREYQFPFASRRQWRVGSTYTTYFSHGHRTSRWFGTFRTS